jgi:hypothetical protein
MALIIRENYDRDWAFSGDGKVYGTLTKAMEVALSFAIDYDETHVEVYDYNKPDPKRYSLQYAWVENK